MFKYQVASLPIEFTGMNFRDIYNYFPDLEVSDESLNKQNKLEGYIPVGDLLKEVKINQTQPIRLGDLINGLPEEIKEKPIYAPSYKIHGRLLIGSYKNVIFYLDPKGDDEVFITGVPKGLSDEEINKFEIPNTIYKYYWEDKYFGYLTQVVNKTKLQTSKL